MSGALDVYASSLGGSALVPASVVLRSIGIRIQANLAIGRCRGAVVAFLASFLNFQTRPFSIFRLVGHRLVGLIGDRL